MKLLGNRILLLPVEKVEGLIEAPQLTKEPTPFGRIVQIGPGSKIEPALAVGQLIRHDTNYGYQSVVHDGAIHRVISATDVQLILE
jgi:hypothetical protein